MSILDNLRDRLMGQSQNYNDYDDYDESYDGYDQPYDDYPANDHPPAAYWATPPALRQRASRSTRVLVAR